MSKFAFVRIKGLRAQLMEKCCAQSQIKKASEEAFIN